MKKIILAILGLVAVGFIYKYYAQAPQTLEKEASQTSEEVAVGGLSFEKPKKSAHYESNTPPHGAILAASPLNVVIDFNFDLTPPSSITIEKDGQEYGVGETKIDPSALALRRDLASEMPDGLYKVSYSACWSDTSCHDGYFQFAIDRNERDGFTDLRNQKEVDVRLSQIKFSPSKILISPGTKVTWINDDPVTHTVNTDSHPAHTYYLAQNSRKLNKGDSYSAVFDKPGIYPYHCSPHAESMQGQVVVTETD